MSKVFDAYGLYYDLLYKDKDYQREVDYTNNLIRRYAPATKHILELGSGTGLHACLFAQKGYAIDGVDQSANMLKLAEQRRRSLPKDVRKTVSFMLGDARHFRSGKKYEVILSLFHVMSYMDTNHDLQNVFDTAAIHLNENGIFIFDCWYGPGVLHEKPVVRKKIIQDAGTSIERISTPTLYEDKHLVDVHFDISVTDTNTQVSTYLEETHRMRYLFDDEIELFSKNSGFELLHAEEWLSGKPLSETSWNAVYVCKMASKKNA